MNFKDFKAERPDEGTRILAFSPVYAVGDPLRIRMVDVLPVGMDEVVAYVDLDYIERQALLYGKFTLYWRDGKKSVIEGATFDAAFLGAGYSAGDVGSLKFYERGDDSSWIWDNESRDWVT